MSNYYQKRDAKVNIAHALMERGWDVQGYSPDQSDLMTDYYCPANWGGIATKNGYILVIDNRYAAESKPIEKYNPKGNLSFDDREKIIKLEAMTQANGATAGEEENAKQLINKIKEKVSDQPAYEIVGYTLAHMGNPKGSIWHIEKDGKIYDKGNTLTKFSNIPKTWQFDYIKMEYKDGYKHWGTISEEKRKIINEFKALILRFERVTMGMNSCGDGTVETEKTGLEQQQKAGYELKTVTKTKTGLKMVEVTDRKYIKVGDYIKTAHHCCYWKVTEEYMRKGTWKGIQEEKKAFIYEQVGKESRGFQSLRNAQRYYDYEFRMIKDIEEGKTKIYELKEVTEDIQVEKWVKIDKTQKSKNTYNSKSKKVQEEKNINSMCYNCKCFKNTCNGMTEPYTGCIYYEKIEQNTTTEQPEENKTILNHEYTIIEDIDTRDNSKLWVLKLKNKVGYDEFCNIRDNILKPVKGYYSRFKGGFIFKYDPTSILQGDTIITAEQKQSKTEKQAENIIDYSTDIITNLGLNHETFSTNEKYKKLLIEKICKITITADIINYIAKDYIKLAEVLQNIKDEEEQKKEQETQQAERANLLEKIEKSINRLEKKINNLSGDYKVNTWKRMKEQESRDSKINSYKFDIKLLEHVQTKLLDNLPITELEKYLIVGSFRDKIHSYYIQKYGRYPREIKFPQIDYSLPSDGWYNKEVPKNQKWFNKYGITDTKQLNNAIDEYKVIYDSVDIYESLTEQKIKKMTNEFKMCQKGDINFTPAKVVDQMIELSNIDKNSIVLEPSAGIGNIADKIKEITNHIEVCEQRTDFCELLKLKNHNVVSHDFLKLDKYNYYDCIIMNPPFSVEQEHLQHAYKLLKDGGKIISITSPSWTFNSNRKSQEFREWFNNIGGEIVQKLESGTFEMTSVNSQIIVINKDSNIIKEAI